MRAAGISGLVRRKRGRTTIRVPGVRVADDLVERQFRPGAPNVLWIADVTYLRTWEGWLYLAAVQDAYSRRIVGWSMADHMRSELVVDALADGRRAPAPGARADPPLRPGLAIRVAGLRPGRSRRRHRPLDGLQGRLLRQRRRRELLRHAQEGARAPPLVADPPRAHLRGLRVHRSLLQPRPPPLHARRCSRPPTTRTELSATPEPASPLRGSHPHRSDQSTARTRKPNPVRRSGGTVERWFAGSPTSCCDAAPTEPCASASRHRRRDRHGDGGRRRAECPAPVCRG